MNTTVHAIRVGMRRGWTEFLISLRNPGDLGFYLVVGAGAFAYLFFNRNTDVEGTSLSMPVVSMPSLLGGLLVFGGVISIAYLLAAEREDGTMLRAKAVPHGMVGYVTGHVTRATAEAVPTLAVIIVPSLLAFDNLMSRGASGWLLVLALILLGLLAAMPLGIIIGSLVRSPQRVGTWGIMPILGIAAISGIFYPIHVLPGWVQAIAQIFPIYWLGLGMRSAFLPDAAAAAEINESWRHLETFGALGLWAAAGLVVAPIVLRRMARRESGSNLEIRRQRALQRI